MENKNGQGIFYGVIGVATLVVAIIGATFAYFGAQQTAGNGIINGQTLGGDGGVVSLVVTPVDFTTSGAVANHNLVPAANLTHSTASTIQTAVRANCEASGYTGCHVYKIVATATDDVPVVTLSLATMTLNNVTDATDWYYSVFQGDIDTTNSTTIAGATATAVDVSGSFNGFSASDTTKAQIYNGDMTTANNTRTITRYLLVYLHEDTNQQDDGATNDSTGSYTGSVTLSAGTSGQITASFSA